MNQKFRVLALLLCVVMVGAVLGACNNTGATPTNAPTTGAAATTAPASSTTTTAPVEDVEAKMTLPLEEKIEIGYFQVFSSKYSSKISSYDEFQYFNWIEEQCNVDFVWNSPSEGSEKEQFGLMIASNDWPDVIQGFDTYYSGGIAAGYDDGIVTNLDPYMADYLPNLSKFYAEFPEWEVQALYEDGMHLTFPYFRNDSNLYNSGLMVRTDIIEAMGAQIPKTIAEFEELLYAFKDYGVKIPFTVGGNQGGVRVLVVDTVVSSAWDIKGLEYQDGATHTAKFGAIEPEFKEILTTLNRWYSEGLLDPDFITNDSSTLNNKVSVGDVGAWYGAGGGNGVTPWQAAVENDINTPMYVVGIEGLSGTAGQTPKTVSRSDGNYNVNAAAILASTSKNPEAVCLVIDYMGYSQEGIQTLMYGYEGVHYVIEDDGRINSFVDVDGGAVSKAEVEGSLLWDPNWTGTSGPYISGIINYDNHTVVHQNDESVYVARWYNPDDRSVATIKNIYGDTRRATWIVNWMNSDFVNNMPLMNYTTEMGATRAEYFTSIETYVLEEAAAFILGERSLDEFDAFVATVKSMGVDKILADNQILLDDYYSR